MILLDISGTTSVYLALGVLIISFLIFLAYFLGFLRMPVSKNRRRSAVIQYRPYANQPRWQMGIEGRFYDYEGFDQTEEDDKLNITKGTLLYNKDSEIVSYPRKLDMNEDFKFLGKRAFAENRVYAEVVADKSKNETTLALEASRRQVKSLETENQTLKDQIEEMQEDEDSKKMKKAMKRGARRTSETISGPGKTIKSVEEHVKIGQREPGRDEDLEFPEEEEEDEFD